MSTALSGKVPRLGAGGGAHGPTPDGGVAADRGAPRARPAVRCRPVARPRHGRRPPTHRPPAAFAVPQHRGGRSVAAPAATRGGRTRGARTRAGRRALVGAAVGGGGAPLWAVGAGWPSPWVPVCNPAAAAAAAAAAPVTTAVGASQPPLRCASRRARRAATGLVDHTSVPTPWSNAPKRKKRRLRRNTFGTYRFCDRWCKCVSMCAGHVGDCAASIKWKVAATY